MKNKRIAVLMGGWNCEKEVSLRSGEAVYQSLISLGYQASKINFSRNIVDDLKQEKPDIVFNALHGQYGEDGRVQGLLDIMQIPYTHSGLLACAVCMDKVLTLKICKQIGVFGPKYHLLKKGEDKLNQEKIWDIGKPFVIKPISEGSSVGVIVIMPNIEFNIDSYTFDHGDEVIVEKYIAGQELNVAIIDGKALGVLEVRPHKLFYDYECKYTPGMTDYIMPAAISDEKYKEALVLAEACYKELGCRGMARIEFILNNKDGGDGRFYLLEVNTHPGFTATSIVPKIAKYSGISFEDIVESLVQGARHD